MRKETGPTSPREPLAITGIGCRFPGGSLTPDLYWQLLADGIDAVGEVPKDRFKASAFYDAEPGRPGKTYSKWGGFVEGYEAFDPAFFGIPEAEAARMDPQ